MRSGSVDISLLRVVAVAGSYTFNASCWLVYSTDSLIFRRDSIKLVRTTRTATQFKYAENC